MTPETQDHMEITPFRSYPIYAGGRLLIGNVTRRTGMTVGTDPIHCRIEVPEGMGSYPREWFPITEVRGTMRLLQLLDSNSSPNGLFLPKEVLLDCYRASWERLHHENADLKMVRDEHQMDNMHAFQEGGHMERAAVVAYLHTRPGYGPVADAVERGEHRRKETK